MGLYCIFKEYPLGPREMFSISVLNLTLVVVLIRVCHCSTINQYDNSRAMKKQFFIFEQNRADQIVD